MVLSTHDEIEATAKHKPSKTSFQWNEKIIPSYFFVCPDKNNKQIQLPRSNPQVLQLGQTKYLTP